MSEGNGTIQALRESVEALQLQAEVARLEFESSYWFHSLADFRTGADRFRNRSVKDPPPSNPQDRKGGANRPIVYDIFELDRLRNNSRWLAETNGFAISIVDQHVSTVIGCGGHFTCDNADIQNFLEVWAESVNLNSEQDPKSIAPIGDSLEQELVRRLLIDGEAIFRLFDSRVKFVEPEWLRDPPGATELQGWSFGIRHAMDPEDVTDFESFHILPATAVMTSQGDEVPADEIVFVKRPGTPSTVKRGVPKFAYDTYDSLNRSSDLQESISIGAEERSKLVWIVRHGAGVSSTAIKSLATAGQFRKTTSTSDENTGTRPPGQTWDVSAEQEFLDPPKDNSTEFQEALAGNLRQAASAFCMSEFQVSGDADVGSWASLKEAGTPWMRITETYQSIVRTVILRLAYRALKWAIGQGIVSEDDVNAADVDYELPEITYTDELKHSTSISMLKEKDVISRDEARDALGWENTTNG